MPACVFIQEYYYKRELLDVVQLDNCQAKERVLLKTAYLYSLFLNSFEVCVELNGEKTKYAWLKLFSCMDDCT